jgi:pyrroline-5-carboxylate reductase
VKLALIGCGFMGEALLNAALRSGAVTAETVFGAEVNSERRAYIDSTYGIKTTALPAEAASGAEVVLLALKPQEFPSVAASMKEAFGDGRTALSIMAGVRIKTISEALGTNSVVRAMPSTPAAIGEGASLWTATADVSDDARSFVKSVLSAAGSESFVGDEKYLDMATALSASGPGFVYLLIEAFIDAGVHIGFARDVAQQLALQTFAGSAKYAQARGVHPAQLRNEVTSPAGTTAAGLQVMEEAGVRGVIIAAIEAAYERSRELGGS